MNYVYVVGTADTKGAELAFLVDRITTAGLTVLCVDVGTRAPSIEVDIAAAEVARHHPDGAHAVLGGDDRGAAVSAMATAFSRFVAGRTDIAGMIGIGGGRRNLDRHRRYARPALWPAQDHGLDARLGRRGALCRYFRHHHDAVGQPISRGLNRLSRLILHNAAQAMSGMVRTPYREAGSQKSLGLTMFGVTTQGVTETIKASQ